MNHPSTMIGEKQGATRNYKAAAEYCKYAAKLMKTWIIVARIRPAKLIN